MNEPEVLKDASTESDNPLSVCVVDVTDVTDVTQNDVYDLLSPEDLRAVANVFLQLFREIVSIFTK